MTASWPPRRGWAWLVVALASVLAGTAWAAGPAWAVAAAAAAGLFLGAPAAVAAALLHVLLLHAVAPVLPGTAAALVAPVAAGAVGGVLHNLVLHRRVAHPERTGDRVAWAAGATVAALAGPVAVAGAVAAAALLLLRRGRAAYLFFVLTSVALGAAAFSLFVPGSGRLLSVGPLVLGVEGAWQGTAGGLRLAAVAGANLAVLAWTPPARLVEGLRLPGRAAAWLAAVLLAAQGLGRDVQVLREARLLDGAWPRRRLARAVAASRLLPALMVAAWRRAVARRDALRLAGIDTSNLFAPVVAVTALAVVGRLAFAAVPNVSPAFVVVFLGGLVFGWRVGALSGLLCMAVTNLALSGIAPHAFVNAPAMALVGAAGGLARRLDPAAPRRADRAAAVLFSASMGMVATFAFSVAADSLTWLLVPEFRGDPAAWRLLVVMGLLFNVVPAIVNAVVFAAAVTPVARAFQAVRGMPRPDPGAAAGRPEAGEAPGLS